MKLTYLLIPPHSKRFPRPFSRFSFQRAELYSYSPYKATRLIFGEVKCISDINEEAFTITEVLCIFSLRSNGSWDSSAAGFSWDTITIA
ncbi:hypothetical protein L3X38_020461 [Prunus dulcis]|uniref:Uncharacterized protein n=1 Tax=Prunus dulcis TaxID=3755 RepID=A0AAD4WF45_PRUDU|nr:hypothetical protein L3X38_020461 [Prunus dulcis]